MNLLLLKNAAGDFIKVNLFIFKTTIMPMLFLIFQKLKTVSLIGLFSVIVTIGYAQSSTENPLPPNLDSYIANVLKTFEVPGMAIGIVQNGKVILSKGYGVKELGKAEKVSEHTLFPIASNSKAFTATALALLVEEGKLEWDAPVVRYMPAFKMSDPFVTENLSVRDLLVHRSGLAPYAGDLMQFPPTTFKRAEIVEKLRYLPLATSFRSTYAYDNVLYLVAGELIKAVSGLEWEDFIQNRIFNKVGMNKSLSRFSAFHDLTDKASSHAPVEGEVQVVRNFKEQGIGDISNPAGGICSNTNDMTKWLITQLDSGRTSSGNRLFNTETTLALWTGVTPIPVLKFPEWIEPARTDLNSYALGLRVYTYQGEKMVTHGGKLDGFVSFVNLVPAKNLGIVVLTNQESSNAYRAVVNYILDHYMNNKPFDWIKGYKKQEDTKFENIAKIENQNTTRKNKLATPALDIQKYSGSFQDAWYGNVHILNEKNGLVMKFEHSPQLVGDMEFWQYNTFIVHWRNRELRADAYVTFSLDENGDIIQIKMKAVSPITDVSYDFHDLLLKPVKLKK